MKLNRRARRYGSNQTAAMLTAAAIPSPAPEPVVGSRGRDQQNETEERVAGLALEEVGRVAVVERRRGRGGAVDHHEAERDQRQRDQRQDAGIHALPLHADRFCTSLLNSSPRASKSRYWS